MCRKGYARHLHRALRLSFNYAWMSPMHHEELECQLVVFWAWVGLATRGIMTQYGNTYTPANTTGAWENFSHPSQSGESIRLRLSLYLPRTTECDWAQTNGDAVNRSRIHEWSERKWRSLSLRNSNVAGEILYCINGGFNGNIIYKWGDFLLPCLITGGYLYLNISSE